MKSTEQLNMQMPDEEYGPKRKYNPLEHMNLMDDFLFDVATVDLETCKIIIELSLGIKIREIDGKKDRKLSIIFPETEGYGWIFTWKTLKGKCSMLKCRKGMKEISRNGQGFIRH